MRPEVLDGHSFWLWSRRVKTSSQSTLLSFSLEFFSSSSLSSFTGVEVLDASSLSVFVAVWAQVLNFVQKLQWSPMAHQLHRENRVRHKSHENREIQLYFCVCVLEIRTWKKPHSSHALAMSESVFSLSSPWVIGNTWRLGRDSGNRIERHGATMSTKISSGRDEIRDGSWFFCALISEEDISRLYNLPNLE